MMLLKLTKIFSLVEPTVGETSTEIVNFIDLNMRIKNGTIITDLYVKPIYGH